MIKQFTAAVLGIAMIAGFLACGKRTVNPAFESKSRPSGADNEAAAVATLATDASTGTDPTISDLQRQIDQERDERLAADNNLQLQIDRLQTTLNLVFANLNDDIARLDRLALDSQTKLIEYQRLADKKIADLEAKLADAKIEDLRIELRDAIARVEKDLENYKDYAANTFATKIELQTLNSLVTNLSGLVTDLESEVNDLSTWVARIETVNIPFLQVQINQLTATLRLNDANDERTRMALQKQIDAMLVAVQAMQATINAQATLIAANNRDIDQMRQVYTRLESEFRTELASLRADVNVRIEQVRQEAIALTTALGNQIQQQFVEVNTGIGTTEQTINATIQIMVENLITLIGTDGVQPTSTATATATGTGTATGTATGTTENALRDQILTVLRPEIQDLSKLLSDVAYDRVLLEFDLVNFVAPFTPVDGVSSLALNNSFRDLIIAQACDGFLGDNDVAAMATNREWFMHLAGEYVVLLAGNVRTNIVEIDRIYFNLNPSLPPPSSIGYSLIAGSLLKSYASDDAKPNCRTGIKNWARRQLLGETPQSAALRKAIADSRKLRERSLILNTHQISLISRASLFETRLVDLLARSFNRSREEIQTFLTTAIGDVRPVDMIVQYLLQIHQGYVAVAEDSASRDRVFLLAKKVAEQTAMNNAGGITVTELNTMYENLKLRVDSLTNSVQNIQISITHLNQNQADSFRFLATLAGRLGFSDLVLIANSKVIEISGGQTSGTNSPARCYAVQHFYNHATKSDNPVSRCESAITLFDTMLTNPEQTRCAIHGVYSTRSNFYGYTWGNLFPIRDRQLFTELGQGIGNGLKINGYEPNDARAKELANRPEGSTYPSDEETTLVYRVLGNATKLRFDVVSETSDTKKQWPYSVTVNAADFLKGNTGQVNIYEVPLPRSISQLGACSWNRVVTVSALAADNTVSAQACKHRFHTFSPVVLNLANSAMIHTIPPTESRIWFDLDGNGILERTGWVRGEVGFLARDLNRNGVIDNGKELFGEATEIGTKRAENGYLALRFLDANRDGVLDARDSIFDELLVWKDINLDGISQPFELRKVKDLGISRIDTDYRMVATGDQIQADAHRAEANLIKYESRFYMPSCGKDGCSSFDVYFGSSEYTAAKL